VGRERGEGENMEMIIMICSLYPRGGKKWEDRCKIIGEREKERERKRERERESERSD
jgi:hypothetical protein